MSDSGNNSSTQNPNYRRSSTSSAGAAAAGGGGNKDGNERGGAEARSYSSDVPRQRVESYPVESVAEDDVGKFGARYADDDETIMGQGHCMELPTTTIEERLEYLDNRDRKRLEKMHLKKLAEQGIARRPDTLVRSKYGPIKALGYRTEGGPKAIMGNEEADQHRSHSAAALTRLAIEEGQKHPRHARSCTPSSAAARRPVVPSGAGVMQIDKD